MSYRLINANTLAANCRQVNDLPCIYADLPNGLDDGYYDMTQKSGALTAEQVEKAIRDCSTYASYDGCTYYASGIRLQAIADELNGELGSGTCDTHWHELFGTPERAARTLRTLIEDGPFLIEESRDSLKPASVCNILNELCGGCSACPSLTGVRKSEYSIAFECDGGDYDALLEWLGGNA